MDINALATGRLAQPQPAPLHPSLRATCSADVHTTGSCMGLGIRRYQYMTCSQNGRLHADIPVACKTHTAHALVTCPKVHFSDNYASAMQHPSPLPRKTSEDCRRPRPAPSTSPQTSNQVSRSFMLETSASTHTPMLLSQLGSSMLLQLHVSAESDSCRAGLWLHDLHHSLPPHLMV